MNRALPFDRISKTVPMLGADGEAEKLAAVRALKRILDGAGASFIDLGEAIAELAKHHAVAPARHLSVQPGQDWRATARWCLLYGAGILSERDIAFVEGIASRPSRALSLRQREWMQDILDRLSLRRSA